MSQSWRPVMAPPWYAWLSTPIFFFAFSYAVTNFPEACVD
jgi:hypothetical protein